MERSKERSRTILFFKAVFSLLSISPISKKSLPLIKFLVRGRESKLTMRGEEKIEGS